MNSDEAIELPEEIQEELMEPVENLSPERLRSIVESVLFTSDKPVSIHLLKQAVQGTLVTVEDIKTALQQLQTLYTTNDHGFRLEEVAGGYQLRTPVQNREYLRRMQKGRPFRLSGPALEVLSIVAYKQPIIKAEVDQIRGVDSGHLLRALMDKQLVQFDGKSDFPGKPMQYATSRKFLEIFSLRNIKELPSLAEIDELLPEGMDEPTPEPGLSSITEQLSVEASSTYSAGEEELAKIGEQLQQIQVKTAAPDV